MSAGNNYRAPCVETIVFPVNDVHKAAGWEARARALGVRIDSVPTWRLGCVACFVSLGTATVFISQGQNRTINCSVIAPRDADLRLIDALREAGLAGIPEEVPA
jgi:hypothetical protein